MPEKRAAIYVRCSTEEQNRLLREWLAGIDYDRESDTLTPHVHHYGASRNHLTPWWCVVHVAS